MTWLEGLKKDATKLWNAHLRECLSLAQVREDTALIIAIQKILRAESICRCWRLIRWAANPTKGGAVTRPTVPHPEGNTLYATREGVESPRWQQLKRCKGANHTVLRLQMDLMCWNVDIIHQNDHFITDADYWLQLGAKLCFDPLFRAYLDLTHTLCLKNPPPTSFPMKPEHML
jgi:hypothetical protein